MVVMIEQGWMLGIHTATSVLGLARLPVGLGIEDASVQQFWDLDRQLAAEMHVCLDSFISPLGWPALVGIAVAIGPGSFTGCRLGVTVARSLGRNLKIPIYGISTLEAWASSVLHPHPVNPFPAEDGWMDPERGAGEVAVRLDAKRGQWYGGVFRRDPSQTMGSTDLLACVGEQLWDLQEWEEMLRCRRMVVSVREIVEPVQDPPVLALTHLAQQAYQQGSRPQWQDVLPHYGRQPPIDPAVLKAVVLPISSSVSSPVSPETFIPDR